MILYIIVIISLALTSAVSGQSSSTSTSRSTSTTSSSAAATHTVSVGADGHHFTPSTVNASVGDIIEYRFYPQNHSVARAAYGQPCIPYEYTGAGRVGFWSGFFPVQLVLTDPPKWQVRVNDSDPIFFYCSAPGACLDGMVGVVNPNFTFSFENQYAFLENTTQSFSPGENPFPKEELPTSTSSISAPTSSPTTPATTSATAAASHKSVLGTGPIVGIAIGGVAFAVLAGIVIYMCGRQKTIREVLARHSAAPAPGGYQPGSPGLSEAQYPNMQKTGRGSLMSGSYHGAGGEGYGQNGGAETESYRSMSPPVDETAGMLQVQGQVMNPGGFVVVGTGNHPNSPGNTTFSTPSPMYFDSRAQDADGQIRQHPPSNYNPSAGSTGPHELAASSRDFGYPEPVMRTNSNPPRRFSFANTESEFAHRDDKGLDGTIR